jgi:hypothetical protein
MDRLEEIKNELETRGTVFGGDTEWLIQEVERLRAVPEAIAQRCDEYVGMYSDSLASGAFREAARIARELGQNG